MDRKQLIELAQRSIYFAGLGIFHCEPVTSECVIRILTQDFTEQRQTIHTTEDYYTAATGNTAAVVAGIAGDNAKRARNRSINGAMLLVILGVFVVLGIAVML